MDDARGVDGLEHGHAVPRRLAALLRERVDVGPRGPVGDARGEGVRGAGLVRQVIGADGFAHVLKPVVEEPSDRLRVRVTVVQAELRRESGRGDRPSASDKVRVPAPGGDVIGDRRRRAPRIAADRPSGPAVDDAHLRDAANHQQPLWHGVRVGLCLVLQPLFERFAIVQDHLHRVQPIGGQVDREFVAFVAEFDGKEARVCHGPRSALAHLTVVQPQLDHAVELLLVATNVRAPVPVTAVLIPERFVGKGPGLGARPLSGLLRVAVPVEVDHGLPRHSHLIRRGSFVDGTIPQGLVVIVRVEPADSEQRPPALRVGARGVEVVAAVGHAGARAFSQ